MITPEMVKKLHKVVFDECARANRYGKQFKKCCTAHIDWKFGQKIWKYAIWKPSVYNGKKPMSWECFNRINGINGKNRLQRKRR